MVLLQKSHDTLTPVCHVLAHHERQVPCFDVLVMNQHLRPQRVSDPVGVSLVRNSVVSTCKDRYRYLFDISELYKLRLALGIYQSSVTI